MVESWYGTIIAYPTNVTSHGIRMTQSCDDAFIACNSSAMTWHMCARVDVAWHIGTRVMYDLTKQYDMTHRYDMT